MQAFNFYIYFLNIKIISIGHGGRKTCDQILIEVDEKSLRLIIFMREEILNLDMGSSSREFYHLGYHIYLKLRVQVKVSALASS